MKSKQSIPIMMVLLAMMVIAISPMALATEDNATDHDANKADIFVRSNSF